jgi:metallophosphoesterase (TIGR03767 family)
MRSIVRAPWRVTVLLMGLAMFVLPGSAAGHEGATAHDTSGKSTLDRTITGDDPARGFSFLRLGPGEPYVTRAELAPAGAGRELRRRSLAYFGQITDFQLADEESPARVEFSDNTPGGAANSAWRPQEALVPHSVEASIRQMNHFVSSPVAHAGGGRAQMDLAVMTGDLADNMQLNETQWVRGLLEGGTLDPSSGTTNLSGHPCTKENTRDIQDPRRYTGVQDYDDYFPSPDYYDPDQPFGPTFGSWPTYRGLMDRAQAPFQAQGLAVPSYVLFGNHDGLTQGTVAATAAYEATALGCLKPLAPAPGSTRPEETLNPGALEALLASNPSRVMRVPPDERRQFVDKAQFKRIFDAGQSDDHGFAYVDQAELTASRGAASYYSWSPKPGLRFIALDTMSEAGNPGDTAEGNLDQPQWAWLERELDRAEASGELVVAFGHHATGSLGARTPDEAAPPCTVNDRHGHDTNPGCDRDPRQSSPVHDGTQLTNLFLEHPRVIAYVAGHSHENRIKPFARKGGGGFWEIKSPAISDWPPQHRLIEVMDNQDGTLSIFGTMLDHDSPSRAPGSGNNANRMLTSTLASIGRTLTWNDPDQKPDDSDGERTDRNVELLLPDPRSGG